MISPLIRTALMVRDLNRSLRFYRDLLGLTETHLPPVDLAATTSWKLLGWNAPGPLRATILKVPGPNFGMLGLFETAHSSSNSTAGARHGMEIGESAIVFYCTNLEEILGRLDDFGGRIVGGPEIFSVAGSDIRPVCEVILRDPDGFAVNLIQTDPKLAYEEKPVRFGA
jgi:catechol 2,3-dioxygenase-like lactoylglutathione lyase family enzyme